MTLKELLARKGEVVASMRKLSDAINAENRDFTPEENTQWDKLNAELDGEIAPAIRRLEIADRVRGLESDRQTDPIGREVSTDERIDHERQRSTAVRAWFKMQWPTLDLTSDEQAACEKFGISPFSRSLNLGGGMLGELAAEMRSRGTEAMGRMARERRDMATTSLGAGGAFVPPGSLASAVEMAMLHYGPMLQVASVQNTATGEPFVIPTANDTTNAGAQLGEAAADSTADPATAQIVFNAYKFTSKSVKVSSEMLRDSAFDLNGWIGTLLGERLGRILNTKFTTGSGAGTPKGIVTAATSGVTAASATAIAFDELIDLVHSVDVAYRNGASFMMHDSVLKAVRKLKDSAGAYLWEPSTQVGVPSTLLGYPVFVNNDMAGSIATTNQTILFGQLSKYLVRLVGGTRQIVASERYIENDQVGFFAFQAADGNLLDAGVAPVKYLVQA